MKTDRRGFLAALSAACASMSATRSGDAPAALPPPGPSSIAIAATSPRVLAEHQQLVVDRLKDCCLVSASEECRLDGPIEYVYTYVHFDSPTERKMYDGYGLKPPAWFPDPRELRESSGVPVSVTMSASHGKTTITVTWRVCGRQTRLPQQPAVRLPAKARRLR